MSPGDAYRSRLSPSEGEQSGYARPQSQPLMSSRSFCTTECVLAAISALVMAFLMALFHWNRYSGVCGIFSDSTGNPIDTEYRCFVENASSMGTEAGPLGISRSDPFWIFACVVHGLVSASTLGTLLYRSYKRRKDEREGDGLELETPSVILIGNESSHGLELYRICWIILMCAVVVVLLCLLELAKGVICRRPTLLMMYYTFVLVALLTQGNGLISMRILYN